MAETIEEAVERLKREAFYDKAPVVACSASDLRSLIRAYEQLVDTVPTLRRMDRTRSIHIAQLGLEAWRSKEHNAPWRRKIDGTPIPNDLTICIADAFYEAAETLASLDRTVPAEEGKPVKRTMTLNLTDEEMVVLEKLAAEQALKPPTVFRQALRIYQLFSLPEGHPDRIARAPNYGADRLPAPPAEGEGKAVAWRWGHQFTSYKDTADKARKLGHDVQPLFSAPSQEPQDARRERYARIIGGKEFDAKFATGHRKWAYGKADAILNSEGARS